MVNEEKLRGLYDSIIKDNPLTTKELKQLGFNSNDINTLIEQGHIIRVKRGLYALKDVNELFYYGKYLIAQKENDKVNLCFDTCFKLDPTHPGTCFQLFLRCLKNEDYAQAFKYFNVIFNGKNPFYTTDGNFYLYLLSMITTIPESYQGYVKSLTFEDLKASYDDKRYADVYKQNKIRYSAFNHRFNLALIQLGELVAQNGRMSVQDVITKYLLKQTIKVQEQNRETISSLIKNKKYQEVIDFYQNMAIFPNLSMTDNYTYLLTEELLNIVNKGIIPKKKVSSTNYLFKAIDDKNYELALKLCIDSNKYPNNPILLLLEEIVKEIQKLKNKKQEEPKEESELKLEESANKPILIEQNRNLNIVDDTNKYSYMDICKLLLNNDLENAYKALKSYLSYFQKQDYEFLIIDLIKISLLENDIAFTKPVLILTLINENNFSFNISQYIQEFYTCISQNNFALAKIYLDIITKGNKYSPVHIKIDDLSQILNASEKQENRKIDTSSLNDADSLESNNTLEVDSLKLDPNVKTNEDSKKTLINQASDLEEKFLEAKHAELLNNKTLIILPPMEENRINNILTIAQNYPDMKAFSIKDGRSQCVVLKYQMDQSEHLEAKNLFALGNQAYKDKNYDECLENYLQLLQYYEKPKSLIYFNIGICYLRKHNKTLAADYLVIANYLARKENLNFDYSDLIARLRHEIPQDDLKPHFKVNLDYFEHRDKIDYYGIRNFLDIHSYIIATGLDVYSACVKLGLSKEEINIIELIYAKEFYAQGNMDMGDLFLNFVEKSKNKTAKVIKILKEIEKNKRFYQNRLEDNAFDLALTLKPKK